MPSDISPLIRKACQQSADPSRAEHFFRQLEKSPASAYLETAAEEDLRILAAVLGGSAALGEFLVAHPDLAETLRSEGLKNPRRLEGLRREVENWSKPALAQRDYTNLLDQLRRFKQREMLRIAARDLARIGGAVEIITEISNVADVCLQTVYQVCYQRLAERQGKPWHQEVNGPWRETAFTVLGMGKLGGQELNYSSDVDLLFVYTAEGFVFKSPPAKNEKATRLAPSHQFFKQLCESMIAELTVMSGDGALYRIDMRLRPEGKAGPLARSLAGYENYYAQWGQTWERMMLLKARCVAGDELLAAEFLEMVQPFRYPRSISEQIPREVAAMKARIEAEVVREGELERNVKLGRGGIREIEFVAQTLQLLRGGRLPFVQGAQTLPALQKLASYGLLDPADAAHLTKCYTFLRDVEHRLQMEQNRQTHSIPQDRKSRERLARLMGFASIPEFEKELRRVNEQVRRVYDKFIKVDPGAGSSALPKDFDDNEAQWKELLAQHKFREPERAVRLLKEFVQGPGFGHVSSRTRELAMRLIAELLAFCPNPDRPLRATGQNRSASVKGLESLFLSDPDRVLARLDTFVNAYGARAMLYETWTSNPSLFQLLLILFDRSEFLAETAIRTPDLLDEIEMSGHLRRRKTAEHVRRELQHGRKDRNQHLWMRKYLQAELMRVGLRDILDLASPEQIQLELTALADACLAYALEIASKKLKVAKPALAIVGLGKLGGEELIYGSDLDLIFVASDDTPALAKLQSVAVSVLDLLSARTELGACFQTDARLRPDGAKGPLVHTLTGYEHYYSGRAMLWEIQALTRARWIAGHESTGRAFELMAAHFSNFKNPRPHIPAYTPDWKKEILAMRMRIEKERTPAGKATLAIKTGAGGLVDAEFIAQTLCMALGWREPNTLRALERAAREQLLSESHSRLLLEKYRQLLRIEFILRRWSFEPESVLPDDPAPLYRVAVRCGFKSAEEFLEAVADYRQQIRKVFEAFFA